MTTYNAPNVNANHKDGEYMNKQTYNNILMNDLNIIYLYHKFEGKFNG